MFSVNVYRSLQMCTGLLPPGANPIAVKIIIIIIIIMSMKDSYDTIGDRSQDLLTCSAMPEPTAPPRAPPRAPIQIRTVHIWNNKHS